MKVLLATDFHLGFSPKSHVTTRSSGKFQEMIFDKAKAIVDNDYGLEYEASIFLADLFDKYSNKENIIVQGIEIARGFDIVMSGNHDIKNVEGLESSLGIVAQALPDSILFTHESIPVRVYDPDGIVFIFLCHYYDQKTFESAIDEAIEKRNTYEDKAVLCIHCNIADGYGSKVEKEGSSLFLTSELEKKVKEHFDLILCGHEHVPRTKGKLRILGNHFPLSFGEIADRFIYILDTDDLSIEAHKVFDASKEYKEFNVIEFLEEEGNIEVGACFVELTGEIGHERRAELSRAILKFWRLNEDVLLSVRNSVIVHDNRVAKKKKAGQDLRELLIESAKKTEFFKQLEEVMAEVDGEES